MKKSLIALAVLAASGAAMAQSSVTLYGLIDTYYANAKWDRGNGVTAPSHAVATGYAGTTQNLIQSGAVNGSRWGLKGSEDLGGGLKANFVLEAGINSDTGAGASALAFHRQASVGFSGGFGAVRLGRVPTYYYDTEGTWDGMFNSALSAAAVAFRTPSGGDVSFEKSNLVSRYDNSVRYDSPNFSGFSGSVQYGFTENKTTSVDAGANWSLGATYAAGPLSAGLAYQQQKATDTAETVSNTRLGASYDFGVAKLKASYGIAGNVGAVKDAKATEYQIAVDYPVSSALTVSANFARSSDSKELDPGESVRNAFGIGAAYTLSKRTFLYGGYVSGKKSSNGSKDDATISALAVGVQHRF
ncbi:MAG: porin [Comamonadaceae bacterium]|nr:porin [Comamonadaceae bacterium]